MYLLESRLIEPTKRYSPDPNMPKNAIFCHHESTMAVLDELAHEGIVENVSHRRPMKVSHFRYNGLEIALINVWTGTHISANGIARYYLHGCRNFINLGGIGAPDTSYKIGEFVVATEAIRDDGYTDSLATKDEPAISDPQVADALISGCIREGVNPRIGKVWTVSSMYAYTREDVDKKLRKGIIGVEGEMAAIAIMTGWVRLKYGDRFGIPYSGNLFYFSDIIPATPDDPWDSILDKPGKMLPHKKTGLKIAMRALRELN